MMRHLATAALAAALLAAPACAQDKPSLFSGGSTSPNVFGQAGLIETPVASTLGDKGISGHAYFTDNFNSYGVAVSPWKRLEVGGTLIDPQGRFGGSSRMIFNAKFNIIEENFFLPGFSAGIVDAFDNLNVGDPSWYVVASKDLRKILPLPGLNLQLHAGYGGGVYNDRIFAGAELDLWTPLDVIPLDHPRFSVLAEYVNKDVNVGLRGRFKGFAATIFLMDWDDFGGGISYTTGLRLFSN